MTDDRRPAGDVPDDPQPSDVTAAELALGLLEGEERATALRRVLADQRFARAVEAWRMRFAQLFDLWPEVEAPEGLIERIDASLSGAPMALATRRFPWPLLAIVSSAMAACLLLVIALRPDAPVPVPAPDGPVLIASIAAPARTVGAVYRPTSGALRIAGAPIAPAGRVAQLWVIGSDGVPHSLGLLAPEVRVIDLTPADRARIAAGATLAISIEPPGGSPKPVPTGPVVATGGLTEV